MQSWLKTLLLSVLLALPPAAPSVFILSGLLTVGTPSVAEARAGSSSSSGGYSRSRSSSGYSRPSASPRTPSFSAPSASSSSGSSGYRRPSLAPPGAARPSLSPQSTADQEMSRRQGRSALESYRQAGQPQAAQQNNTGGFSSTARPNGPSAGPQRRGQADDGFGYQGGGGWGGGNWSGGGFNRGGGGWASGWQPPRYANNTSPRFGVWNGLFLWFLLDNMSRAGSVDFFHNHRDDPGYAQWRAEAEKRAQTDGELRGKLDQLDHKLVEKQGQPRDANYLPPDTPREVAVADKPPALNKTGNGMERGLLLVVLLVGGGVLVMLWWARRRQASRSVGAASAPGPVGMAGRILHNKLSGERYTPSLFRVGMTLTVDPTPFILAGGAIKAQPPEAGASGVISVEAVGRLEADGASLHRLYLPGGRSFFQLHLGADGRPDECRYFSAIDEVTPASKEDWAFWLDPVEGMIGWPEFQTKDGKLYARQWGPGSERIAPRVLSETRKEVNGERSRTLHAMLYAAPTGAAAPAPETECILVSAVEEGGQAWIEIHAGIDVNPATLTLA